MGEKAEKIVVEPKYDTVLKLWKIRLEKFFEIEEGRLKILGVPTSLVSLDFLLTFIISLDKYMSEVGWEVLMNFGRLYGYRYAERYLKNRNYTKEEIMRTIPYMLWLNGLGKYKIEYAGEEIRVITSRKNKVLIYGEEEVVNPFVLGYITGILEATLGSVIFCGVDPKGEEVVFKFVRKRSFPQFLF